MAPALLSNRSSSESFTRLSELNASKLQIFKNPFPTKISRPEELKFGQHVTDHMLQVNWTIDHGWESPQILPYQKISLDPTACVFHYGFECFEGMKAYKDASGRVRLFRPRMNIDRFNRSAERLALPTFDPEELFKLIAIFVQLEERFIVARPGYSLYLRPVLIGTSGGLGVTSPTAALLYLVASPVGAYFSGNSKGISLEATSSSVATRAWPGGPGSHKVGGNYAPCIAPERAAQRNGYQQCLWLFGEDDAVTEAGTMNLFVILRVPGTERIELVTPPLDGMILPGVTRDCILSLAREKYEPQGWLISERKITMLEIVTASDAGELLEVFGSGTAAVVSPISSIRWKQTVVKCGSSEKMQRGEDVAGLMKGWIEARQCGMDEHQWSVIVDGIKK